MQLRMRAEAPADRDPDRDAARRHGFEQCVALRRRHALTRPQDVAQRHNLAQPRALDPRGR
jgi:hypothetical protein